MKHRRIGVFPTITAQVKRCGALDFDATTSHTEALLASDVTGLTFLGSLGENQSLDANEKRLVMEAMIKVVNGRVPVFSGVAETSTPAACRYLRDCETLGADGFMRTTLMVYKSPDPAESGRVAFA